MACGSERHGKNNSVRVFSSTQYWPTVTAGDYVNIALVKLDKAVTLNEYIKTIRIPAAEQANLDYTSKNITALNRFRKFNFY